MNVFSEALMNALESLIEGSRIRDGTHLEALLGEIARQQIAQPQVIVDHQDFRLALVHCRMLSRM